MSTLKKQFEGEYLHKANDNYVLALKRQAAQVESCVHDIMRPKYEAKRSRSMAAARKHLCDRQRPFGAKEERVDAGIDGALRFFNHNYTVRQAEICDVKKHIRCNARRLMNRQLVQEEPLARAMGESIHARFHELALGRTFTITNTVSPRQEEEECSHPS
jgi:hypothetical protein